MDKYLSYIHTYIHAHIHAHIHTHTYFVCILYRKKKEKEKKNVTRYHKPEDLSEEYTEPIRLYFNCSISLKIFK